MVNSNPIIRSRQPLCPKGAFKTLIKSWTHDPNPTGTNHKVTAICQDIEVTGQTRDTWDVGTSVMVIVDHRELLGVNKAYIKRIRLLALDPDDRYYKGDPNKTQK